MGKNDFFGFDELSCVKIVGRKTANHTETAKKQKNLLETEKQNTCGSKPYMCNKTELCIYVETRRINFTQYRYRSSLYIMHIVIERCFVTMSFMYKIISSCLLLEDKSIITHFQYMLIQLFK